MCPYLLLKVVQESFYKKKSILLIPILIEGPQADSPSLTLLAGGEGRDGAVPILYITFQHRAGTEEILYRKIHPVKAIRP